MPVWSDADDRKKAAQNGPDNAATPINFASPELGSCFLLKAFLEILL